MTGRNSYVVVFKAEYEAENPGMGLAMGLHYIKVSTQASSEDHWRV